MGLPLESSLGGQRSRGARHAQHGEVQCSSLRDEGIPIHQYTVNQYSQLVELARNKARVQVVRTPALRASARAAAGRTPALPVPT